MNTGHYVGIEPNAWLVTEGIDRELGNGVLDVKKLRSYYSDSAAVLRPGEYFDFVVAQSIFSHCGLDIIALWLSGLRSHLTRTSALVATFIFGRENFSGSGWIYPECVSYELDTIKSIASENGYVLNILDWAHPRQSWTLLTVQGCDTSRFTIEPLTWNTRMRAGWW